MGEIIGVASRAAQLTRQLLIFGRREVAKPEVIDLNAVVSDMVKLLRQTPRRDHRVGDRPAPDLPRTRVDPGQIEQVLMNLVVNARDAMPGGGSLRIETEAHWGYGEPAANPGPDSHPGVCLSVSDTRSGMSPAVQSRAFEPFFTTKVTGEGSDSAWQPSTASSLLRAAPL